MTDEENARSDMHLTLHERLLRSRSKRSLSVGETLGWPLSVGVLGALLILLLIAVVCMCRRSSARRRAKDGQGWVKDDTPIVFEVNPGYDNLAFSAGSGNAAQQWEMNSNSQ